MTTKTIKTILFASLIAAMILPFSGMNYAAAELSDSQKEQLISKLEKLQERIDSTTNESLKEKLEAKQQIILEKLYEDIDIEKLTQAEIDESVDENNISTAVASILFNIYGTHSGCDDGVEVFNFMGTYNSGSTWIYIDQYFPNELTSGDSPYCEEHAWEDNVYLNIANIWDNSGCISNLDVDPVDSYWLNCGVVLGGIYVVKVTADYDGEQIGSYSYFWA